MAKSKEQRAKELSLKVWDYFRKHPEIKRKADLPFYLLVKIYRDISANPLCTLYYEMACSKCPLINCKPDSIYIKWKHALDIKERQQAATEIYNTIKEWKV